MRRFGAPGREPIQTEEWCLPSLEWPQQVSCTPAHCASLCVSHKHTYICSLQISLSVIEITLTAPLDHAPWHLGHPFRLLRSTRCWPSSRRLPRQSLSHVGIGAPREQDTTPPFPKRHNSQVTRHQRANGSGASVYIHHQTCVPRYV